MDISTLTPVELLTLHAQVAEELRTRGITRTSNNPTGDLAEFLFCRAFGWKLTGRSYAHIDALGADGIRYQIKGRRVTRYNPSRQLGALRELVGTHFDFLAAVLFAEDFTVMKAALIPHNVALDRAKFVARTNSHRFLLRDDVWNAPGVKDVTRELRAVDFLASPEPKRGRNGSTG